MNDNSSKVSDPLKIQETVGSTLFFVGLGLMLVVGAFIREIGTVFYAAAGLMILGMLWRMVLGVRGIFDWWRKN